MHECIGDLAAILPPSPAADVPVCPESPGLVPDSFPSSDLERHDEYRRHSGLRQGFQ